jgi:hypothetical protein
MEYDKRESMRLEQNSVFSDLLVAMQLEYYQHHGAGGPLHITLDDQNVEDTHLKFCRTQASFEGDMAGLAILDMLEQLDEGERYGVIQQAHMGWSSSDDDEETAVNFQCWRCRAHCPQRGPFKFYSMVTCAKCDVTSPMYNKRLI